MTALTTLVEPLKRELAVPGVFDDVFPDTDDTALADSLADGFAEAQLQGFFSTVTLGASPNYETSEALSLSGGALIVMFTAQRILRAWLRSLALNERYKAGNVEYETARSTNLLRDELALIKERLDKIVTEAARTRRAGVGTVVLDNYWARVGDPLGTMSAGGLYIYELGA